MPADDNPGQALPSSEWNESSYKTHWDYYPSLTAWRGPWPPAQPGCTPAVSHLWRVTRVTLSTLAGLQPLQAAARSRLPQGILGDMRPRRCPWSDPQGKLDSVPYQSSLSLGPSSLLFSIRWCGGCRWTSEETRWVGAGTEGWTREHLGQVFTGLPQGGRIGFLCPLPHSV